jgi:hypothetical protein
MAGVRTGRRRSTFHPLAPVHQSRISWLMITNDRSCQQGPVGCETVNGNAPGLPCPEAPVEDKSGAGGGVDREGED